jgi:hypothetical protein
MLLFNELPTEARRASTVDIASKSSWLCAIAATNSVYNGLGRAIHPLDGLF